ncbi:MAG: 2-hydroxyacid dehydrogenase [Candidatus Helarchaeota archaeon]
MYKVLVTREFPFYEFHKFGTNFKFFINKGHELSRQEILNKIVDMDGLICTLRNQIDKEIMDAAGTNLKVISNYAVGFDNIDIEAATERNIFVTNTPNVLTETTADLAWALIMTISRRIVEAHNFIINSNWKDWYPLFFAGRDVYGKTIGIIGMGRIGSAIARRASGFNMNIIYYSRTQKHNLEKLYSMKFKPLNELLQSADFIVLSIPLTPLTENLISYHEFSLMKKSAFLINISRGKIINENALILALQNKMISGVGLDVFPIEPINSDNPLLKLPNVVLTPHIGSSTVETRSMMAKVAFENVFHVLLKNLDKAFIVNSNLIP